MPEIVRGRVVAGIEGSFVVFLIGVRVNRLLAVNQWLPVTQAMPRMLRELEANPELGLLHAQPMLVWRGAALVQYWRSFDHLHAYANARNAEHLPAWAAFNRAVGNSGSVGIWHETYRVEAGAYEAIYGDMPRWGLGMAGALFPVAGWRKGAKSRMAGAPAGGATETREPGSPA